MFPSVSWVGTFQEPCAGLVTHACFGKVNTAFCVWGYELFSWAREDKAKMLVSLSPGLQVPTISRCGMVCLPWSLSSCTPLPWQLWSWWLFSTRAPRPACTTRSWSEWTEASASLCPWWPSPPVSRIVSPLPSLLLDLLPQWSAWRHRPCLGRKRDDSSEVVLLLTLYLHCEVAHCQHDC